MVLYAVATPRHAPAVLLIIIAVYILEGFRATAIAYALVTTCYVLRGRRLLLLIPISGCAVVFMEMATSLAYESYNFDLTRTLFSRFSYSHIYTVIPQVVAPLVDEHHFYWWTELFSPQSRFLISAEHWGVRLGFPTGTGLSIYNQAVLSNSLFAFTSSALICGLCVRITHTLLIKVNLAFAWPLCLLLVERWSDSIHGLLLLFLKINVPLCLCYLHLAFIKLRTEQ